MAVIMIDVKGLLEGKRLRKLGLKARLYYPLFLGLANTFARLELDYDLLAARFITFHDPDTTNIVDWFKEYEQAKLVFIYDGHDTGAEEPTQWAQFDTPVAFRRKYASTEDDQSPEPLEPAYTDWLKAIHGAEWEQFHLTKYQKERQSDISAKRAEAGRKGGAASGVSRRSKQNEANGSNGHQTKLDVDVDVDVDADEVVDGDGVVTALHHCIGNGNEVARNNTNLNTSFNGHDGNNQATDIGKAECRGTTRPEKTDSPHSAAPPHGAAEEDARAFATTFHELMAHNPHSDPTRIPKAWERLWTEDFRALLDNHSAGDVGDLIVLSQAKHNQKYFVRPTIVAEKAEKLLTDVRKLKEANAWVPLVTACNKALGYEEIAEDISEEEIEFLDKDKPSTTAFSLEDEDDELAATTPFNVEDEDDDLA
jgi:hypothetical protein